MEISVIVNIVLSVLSFISTFISIALEKPSSPKSDESFQNALITTLHEIAEKQI